MTIKLLLLASLAVFAFFAYRSPDGQRSLAVRRIIALTLLLSGAVAVLFPDYLSFVAHSVGVGRGVDLLMYIFIVTSLFTWLALYQKIHSLETRITALTREIALQIRESPLTPGLTETDPRHSHIHVTEDPSPGMSAQRHDIS